MSVTELHPSIVPLRHGSAAPNSDRLLHLLPRTWDGSQRTRPALCGQRRITWKSSEALADKALGWETCEACDQRAHELAHPKPPVRLAATPAPSRGRTNWVPIERTVILPNTQADRIARRVAFRESFRLGDEGRAYLRRRRAELSNQS